ncbi:MAG TPA: SDR family oxidoreductase [Alkalispirochaeta sp.]|nr:SDR family oxidoreductase [Alkalispirochaeta sp.]
MKILLITGATTGIGAALARTIPQAGDTVFLHYHANGERCTALADELKQRGAVAHTVQADFAADPDGAARTLADRMAATADRLDVLINNAGGIIQRQTVAEAEYTNTVATINLNLVAPMMLCTYCSPLLDAAVHATGRADVVNISSIAARSGSPTSTPYGAAKAGLENFTRGFAKEVGPGIRVNTVSPGVIDTPFHHGTTPSEQMDRWLAATPVGHHGTPEAIAAAVGFVLANGFMSGAVVPVNGGIQMI